MDGDEYRENTLCPTRISISCLYGMKYRSGILTVHPCETNYAYHDRSACFLPYSSEEDRGGYAMFETRRTN